VDAEDDLVSAPGHDELQASAQMDVGSETINKTISLDATSEEIKSGSSVEMVPCPPDVAPPSTHKPKSKLSNIQSNVLRNALIPDYCVLCNKKQNNE
jgi:hypothetical protein